MTRALLILLKLHAAIKRLKLIRLNIFVRLQRKNIDMRAIIAKLLSQIVRAPLLNLFLKRVEILRNICIRNLLCNEQVLERMQQPVVRLVVIWVECLLVGGLGQAVVRLPVAHGHGHDDVERRVDGLDVPLLHNVHETDIAANLHEQVLHLRMPFRLQNLENLKKAKGVGIRGRLVLLLLKHDRALLLHIFNILNIKLVLRAQLPHLPTLIKHNFQKSPLIQRISKHLRIEEFQDKCLNVFISN